MYLITSSYVNIKQKVGIKSNGFHQRELKPQTGFKESLKIGVNSLRTFVKMIGIIVQLKKNHDQESLRKYFLHQKNHTCSKYRPKCTGLIQL